MQKCHLRYKTSDYLWNEAAQNQSYYTVSIETRVRPIDWWQIWWPSVNFGQLFREQHFPQRISRTHFVLAQPNLASSAGWPIETYSPNFVNFGPCLRDTMRRHASVLHCNDTVVKWFFDNFPMFANSSSVVSIHCVARGLGASFLYKCSASRDGFLRQHGLLVLNVADEVCRHMFRYYDYF